jgi:hypothetical protein
MGLFTEQPRVRKRSNLYVALYGAGGGGKTLLGLQMMQRIIARDGGKGAVVDTDNGSWRYYAASSPGADDGFSFPDTTLHDNFSPERLHQIVDEAEASGVTCLLFDSFSPFWDKQGGLFWRNEHQNAPTRKSGKSDSRAGWSITNVEEDAVFDRLRAYCDNGGHVILSLEQRNENGPGETVIGVIPRWRSGFPHRVDFVVRVERYSQQIDTKHDPTGRGAFVDGHRAILEKTRTVGLRVKADGTTEKQPVVPTGAVFDQPSGAEIVDRILDHFHAVPEPDWKAIVAEYMEQLPSDRDGLLDAYREVDCRDWPAQYREWAQTQIKAIGLGKKASEGPIASASPDGWRALEPNSPVDEWTAAGKALVGTAEVAEVDAFQQHAEACGRSDNVAVYIKERRSQIAAEAMTR